MHSSDTAEVGSGNEKIKQEGSNSTLIFNFCLNHCAKIWFAIALRPMILCQTQNSI